MILAYFSWLIVGCGGIPNTAGSLLHIIFIKVKKYGYTPRHKICLH